MLFVVNSASLIFSALSQLPLVGALSRSVEYALNQSEPLNTGRMYYALGLAFLVFKMLMLPAIGKSLYQRVMPPSIFRAVESLVYFSVVFYPVLSSFGYFVRFSSYGLALVPAYIVIHFVSLQKRLDFSFVGIATVYCLVYVVSLNRMIIS
jgi:hypothetical protein